MPTLRDIVIFFAGAAFFHTISHIICPYFIALPFDAGFMQLTHKSNLVIIIISAIMTIALLWWAKKLKK
jgi:hypothetical protein